MNPTQNFSPIKDSVPDLFTIEDFNKMVIDGILTEEDGVGYYANAEKISSVRVVPSEIIYDYKNPPPEPPLPPDRVRSRMSEGTHVAWFGR